MPYSRERVGTMWCIWNHVHNGGTIAYDNVSPLGLSYVDGQKGEFANGKERLQAHCVPNSKLYGGYHDKIISCSLGIPVVSYVIRRGNTQACAWNPWVWTPDAAREHVQQWPDGLNSRI